VGSVASRKKSPAGISGPFALKRGRKKKFSIGREEAVRCWPWEKSTNKAATKLQERGGDRKKELL